MTGALLAAAWLASGSVPAAEEIRLPLLLDGGFLAKEGKRRKRQAQEVLTRQVVLPTRGVWYVWLKATNPGWRPATLTWDLDGMQPLHSSRAEMLVPPHAKGTWLTYTRYGRGPGFKMQVHAEAPGTHTLNVRLQGEGAVEVDRIALTLFFAAEPTRDGATLDHALDPGRGRAFFPDLGPRVDGYRADWTPPALKPAGRTYHVDATGGDDSRSGLAPGQAWKSFAPVNARTFSPGDAILLKRGEAWHEGLHPAGSGTQGAWITLGAYGDGARPRVNGGTGPAVLLTARSYWEIRDLDATVDPEAAGTAGAIVALSGEGLQPKGVRILNCVASDTGGSGIFVGCEWQKGEGFDGVLIENCLSFAHSGDGITVTGTHQHGCRNAVIRNCTTHGADGMAGMWIESGQNGLIENCVSYDNATYNIWTWNSVNVTMRRCEGFRGRQPGAAEDSGGFDIDWGCEACTVEYCYSHHNKGCGYLLMGSERDDYLGDPKTSRYNLCRYNVSAEDGHAILLYNTFEDGLVHGNLLVGHWKGVPAVVAWGWGDNVPARTTLARNVILGLDGGQALGVDESTAAVNGLTLRDNVYWCAGKRAPEFRWGGQLGDYARSAAHTLTGLEAFRQAGARDEGGTAADPGFAAAGASGLGRLPLPEYRAAAGSPARVVARRVPLDPAWLEGRRKFLTDTGAAAHGIPMDPAEATVDYWGEPLVNP